MDEDQLVERLRTTPPSYLKGFSVVSAEAPQSVDGNVSSSWQIACRCGGAHGRFLGYPLRSFNPEDNGPECFLSPLAFECSSCNVVTELLDTDRHGYHAEASRREGDEGESAKLRGEGPREAFGCPKCGQHAFKITVGFEFWYTDELAEEFDEAWEELFSLFYCDCQCTGCGQVSQPTEFGKL